MGWRRAEERLALARCRVGPSLALTELLASAPGQGQRGWCLVAGFGDGGFGLVGVFSSPAAERGCTAGVGIPFGIIGLVPLESSPGE